MRWNGLSLRHDQVRAVKRLALRPGCRGNGRRDRHHLRELEGDRIAAHEHAAEIRRAPTDLQRLGRGIRHVIKIGARHRHGVPLLPTALAYARANSPVTVGVIAHLNQTTSCKDIAQLATTCAQIVAADPRAGDGLERVAAGDLQVSAT